LELTVGVSWNEAVPVAFAVQLKCGTGCRPRTPAEVGEIGPFAEPLDVASTRCVTSVPAVARPESHGNGRQSAVMLPVNRSTSCLAST